MDALLAVLEDPGDVTGVRGVAMLALSTDRSGATDLPPPQIRARTSEGFSIALGTVEDPRVEEALARALTPQGNDELCFTALMSVGESLDDPVLAWAVVEVAFSGETLDQRLEAIERLSQSHAGEYACEALTRIVATAYEPALRKAATHALGSYPYPGVVDTLSGRLADRFEDEAVRVLSVESLSRVAGAAVEGEALAAVRVLTATLAGPGPSSLQEAARAALARLAGDPTVPEAVRSSARAALG